MPKPRPARRRRTWAIPDPPPLPPWHGLLAPVAANAFAELNIGAALWIRGGHWSPFHVMPDVVRFEHEHGVGAKRWAQDGLTLEQVCRTRRVVHREYAGFHDLFVPVADAGEVPGVLVAGPFARTRPTSSEIRSRWHALTGSQGLMGDPSFVEYVAATLATLTLEGSTYDAFERLLECFVGLVDDRVPPQRLFAETQEIRAKLVEIRVVERIWKATRDMLDERTGPTWALRSGTELGAMGMQRLPQHVVVGLVRGQDVEPDPVDDLIRRDAFQRASAELAQEIDGVGSSPVADYGVAFLIDHAGPRARTRTFLSELATRATALARRFGFGLHVGVSQANDAKVTLATRHRAALWAAEKALSDGIGLAYGEPRRERRTEILRELRAELSSGLGQKPSLLSPRFERYIEAVLSHSGYRLDRARTELGAGLERLTDPLLAAGVLDRKSCAEIFATLEERSENARTVSALVSACRTLVLDIQKATVQPTAAHQERGLRRAIGFMKEHSGERISIRRIARVAGFGPDHFCRVFKREEGTTPELYLQHLRVEQSKQILTATSLNLEAVRKLCGFQSRNYFHRVFKHSVGMTPLEFRRDIKNALAMAVP